MSTALDTESKNLIETTLQRFVEECYGSAECGGELSSEELSGLQFWPMLAELGVLGLPFGEEQGGLGGHPQDVADAVTILAKGLIREPFVEAGFIAGALLSAAQAHEHIERLICGDTVTILLDGLRGEGKLVARVADGLRLNGRIPVQPYAEQADQWLLAVQMPDQSPALLLVPRADVQAAVMGYRLLDSRPAGDVVFDDVALPSAQMLLQGGEAEQALCRARAQAACGYASDAVGVMAALLKITAEYLTTRKQFGVTLSTFQALQHRLADMQIAYVEARAIVRRLSAALESEANDVLEWLAYAAYRVTERASRLVGQEAIQMHGGMGVTDELIVSHYNNRLVVRVRQLQACVNHDVQVVEPRCSMDSSSSGDWDEQAFRAEVREFVSTHLDPATRHKVENGLYLEKHDYVQWQKALRSRGWFGAAWPERFGGSNWSVRQEHVFLQECALQAAPMLIPYGVNMLGPVLHAFGTDEQREAYLPGILNSDTWWCQGYSEPNAGSDLASLSTTATLDGDHWVVNGTKMWTTEAHWADMMHCLVRTDRSGKKQQGITFLLIDMRSPGITVEPIVTLDGVHHTNQVFFDNVRVPVENVVGEVGGGWTLAKFLLSRERGFIADTGNKLRLMTQIRATVERYRPASAALRAVQCARLLYLEAALAALVALERDYIEDWELGQDDGIGASVLKVRGTELLQQMTEFWRDALGAYGACYDAALRKGGDGLAAQEPWVQAASVNYSYLYARCWSIFGGTNEVQRSIIAGTLLRS